MKYALIADIHANLEAFEVVLEDAQKNNCTHYVCLGDVVGYNPNPCECIKIVRDMEMPCIMGNHDEYCAGDIDLSGFNPHAGRAIIWTRDQLNDEERDWLQRLKYLRMIANFTIVHATLDLFRGGVLDIGLIYFIGICVESRSTSAALWKQWQR